MEVYPLVNLYITNWKDPPCYENGKIHDFDWAMVKFANCKRLPGRVSRLSVYKLRILYTKAQQKESPKHMSFRSSQSKHLCVLFLGITRLKRTSLSNLTWNHPHIPDLVLPILGSRFPFFLRSIEAIYTWIIWAKQHFKACWKDM